MKLIINIDLDNDAFAHDDDEAFDPSEIVSIFERQIRPNLGWLIREGDGMKLRDTNGNSVGVATVTR